MFEIIRSDWEVLEALLRGRPAMIAYLAFSLYTHDKHKWRLQFEKARGKTPSGNDTAKWIEQCTEEYFSKICSDAGELFDEACKNYMRQQLEDKNRDFLEYKTAFEHSAIINEVRKAGGWWKQLGIAVATGIVSPLIIALFLILGAYQVPAAVDISHVIGRYLLEKK